MENQTNQSTQITVAELNQLDQLGYRLTRINHGVEEWGPLDPVNSFLNDWQPVDLSEIDYTIDDSDGAQSVSYEITGPIIEGKGFPDTYDDLTEEETVTTIRKIIKQAATTAK